MKPLGSSLSKNIGEKGLSHKIRAALISEHFQKLLHRQMTSQQLASLESVAYRSGACIVRAGSAALKQEIKLRQAWYLEEINKEFGPKTAEKIIFS